MPIDPSHADRIVLFGGTFDPPHVAHVRLPLLAKQKLGADLVCYIPAAVSPFKRNDPPTHAKHRVAMLTLALRDHSDALIDTIEIDRQREHPNEPSYTIDTLRALRAKWGEKPRLHWLIGTDHLMHFHKWKEADEVIRLGEPRVMVRPPHTRQSVMDELPDAMSVERWRERLLELPVMDVSATELRAKLAAGDTDSAFVKQWIDEQVLGYIRDEGLYRG